MSSTSVRFFYKRNVGLFSKYLPLVQDRRLGRNDHAKRRVGCRGADRSVAPRSKEDSSTAPLGSRILRR